MLGIIQLVFWLPVWTCSTCYALTLTADDYNKFTYNDIFGSPLIIPTSSDITIDAGTNYTLTCESRYNTTWKLPNINHGYSLEYEINYFKTQDKLRPYGSVLKLFDVRAQNVGDYFCVHSDISAESDNLDDMIIVFKAAKIYVFVDDPENLLVPNEHPVITAYQFADVIIPCKPTSKAVDVELVKAEDESQEIDFKESYDPRIGYKIKIMHLTDSGTYICRKKHSSFDNDVIFFHITVMMDSPTEFINKPTITTPSGGHASQGENLKLDCSVDVRVGVIFSIDWQLPNDNIAKREGRVFISDTIKEAHPISSEIGVGKSQLIIRDVNKIKDSGYYNCVVVDHSNNKNRESKLITILNKDESYINISEPTGHYKIEISSKRPQTQMLVKYRGYPKPVLTWFDNKGRIIQTNTQNDKYTIIETDSDIMLKIRNIELQDTGEYHLKASNDLIEKELKFTLIIKEKPSVSVENIYVQKGKKAKVICECAGYPESIISWSFTPCKIRPSWPTCDYTKTIKIDKTKYITTALTSLSQKSVLDFITLEPGIAKCSAKNSEGNDSSEAQIIIGDLDTPFSVYGIDDNQKIAVGDNITLICGALAYNYSANLYWFHDQNVIDESNVKVIEKHSNYSYKKILSIKNVQHKNAGNYECRANPITHDNETESKYIYIQIFDPNPPIIKATNLHGKTKELNLGELLHLECKFFGIPEPTILWYRDNERITEKTNRSKATLEENNTVLKIPFIKPEDEGTYKCVVENRLGSESRIAHLKISNLPGLRLSWILTISGIIILLILFIIYLCVRVIRERELLKQMKAAGLANFEEGAVEFINPALTLDEQADLLPYDRRFEFPRERLKLGKQLGAGAFGVVLKGIAENIIPDEKETTVAVKMVKKTADNEVMKALVSELKIMVHLGQHLNVVNILGAVTKNIAKREVMIIVEYCRYGNLQNFLLKNRKRFINQINPETDLIDSNIKTQRWSSDYEYNSQGLKYVKLSFSNQKLNNSKTDEDRKSIPTTAQNMNSKGYIRRSEIDYIGGSNMDSCNTEQTLIPYNKEGDENIILSNNSIQPGWRSNYKPDGSEAMDITSTNLVSWAFQVARGMDYLATRKVLHGDLAARNILLCDDNIVKICDFGLARSMYKTENYKKQGEARLPVKWLALESLGDQVFSTYSDIWSFGIVLWEFFSLSKVPYPGMEPDQSLYLKLKDGYRMEKPEYANQELYSIMLECWSAHPESRPSFAELEKRFAKMLEDDVTNHYIDLNEPYLRINSLYYKQGGTDYLALMGVPDDVAPQPPRYVNDEKSIQLNPQAGNVLFNNHQNDEYIRPEQYHQEAPNSPTISNNLDSLNTKQRKKAGIPEEIPMLKHNNSDSEGEITPDLESAKKSFLKLDLTPEQKSALNDSRNYVNINGKDSKKLFGTKDAFSNPGYLMLTSVNENRK